MSADWSAKTKWMRQVGASEAVFAATTGELISVKLGPEPIEPTQPSTPNPFEQEKHAREERRRVASAASGGPVLRLCEDRQR